MRVSIPIAVALVASASANPVQHLLANVQATFTGLAPDVVDLIEPAGCSSRGASASILGKLWPPWSRRPSPPPKVIDLSKYTIGQILSWTLKHHGDEHHRTLPLHKLAWAVNQSEIAQKIYRDESLSMTLFAPVDEGLHRPPHHRHGHEHEHDGAMGDHPFYSLGQVDDDSDRHERFVKIINLLLMYHTLPESYSAHELADHSTVRTTLNTTKDSKVGFRLRVEPHLIPRPELAINFYSKTRFEVIAKNGRIFGVSAPLFPPPSPLSTALLFPGAFSTLTSGVQLAELDRELAPWLHRYPKSDDEDESEHSIGSIVREVLAEIVAETAGEPTGVTAVPEYTVLAPTNLAFLRLGPKINLFLGSPFGRKALKGLLSYHVLPGLTLHSDFLHNSTVKIQGEGVEVEEQLDVDYDFAAAGLVGQDEMAHLDQLSLAGMLPMREHHGHDHPRHPPPPPPHHGSHGHGRANVTHLRNVKTALGKHTVDIDIVQYRYFGRGPIQRRVVVKPEDDGPIPVLVKDVVARSGAIHVLGKVLKPSIPHHHHHDGGDREHRRALEAFNGLL